MRQYADSHGDEWSPVTVPDPITERILSDSPYERLRAQQFSYLVQPIDRKLLWQSGLLFLLAALLPVLAVLPASIRTSYLPNVVIASPKVAFLALVAVLIVAGTGVGHALVEYARLRLQPLDEGQARELVTLEGLCSMLGFGTGGFATLVTYALVLIGFGGQEALNAFLEAGGGNPFAPSAFGVTVGMVAITALVSAAALQLAAASLHLQAVRLEQT